LGLHILRFAFFSPKSKAMKFLALIALFTSFVVDAKDLWSESSQRIYERYANPIDDRFLSTLKGSCEAKAPRYRSLAVEVEDFRVKSPAHRQGELPVKLGLQRDGRGLLIQAPVIYVVPGAFNNLNHKQPRALMEQFSRLGHHVVMFPNPWGTQYIAHGPVAPTGSFEAEGQAIYQALRRIHHSLKAQGLILNNESRVYGVSYGGFVAAMIAGLDAQHADPLITREITIVAPPFHIGRTLFRLDDLIDETQSYVGIGLPGLLRRFAQVCYEARSNQGDFDDERRLKDAKGLAASQGFHAELVVSLKALDRVNGWNSIPHRTLGWLSPRYRHWYRTLNFESYFQRYMSDAFERAFAPEANLYHWIELDHGLTHGRARVLVADDDFLNDYSWSVQSDFAGPETLYLHNGGHYGFRSLHWYREFINHTFFRGFNR
jgi:hypothetical protein